MVMLTYEFEYAHDLFMPAIEGMTLLHLDLGCF